MAEDSKSWNLATLEGIMRCTTFFNTDVITYKGIIHTQMSIIVEETQTKGKTPRNTLSRVLQVLRDIGILEFVDNKGTYRVKASHGESLKNILTRSKKSMSNGERTLSNLLKDMGITSTREKKFPWLTGETGHPLRLDRYIDNGLIAIAIEVDGPQHFHPVPYFGGMVSFTSTVLRDSIKNTSVLEHGIHMIRISSEYIQTQEGKMILFETISELYQNIPRLRNDKQDECKARLIQIEDPDKIKRKRQKDIQRIIDKLPQLDDDEQRCMRELFIALGFLNE